MAQGAGLLFRLPLESASTICGPGSFPAVSCAVTLRKRAVTPARPTISAIPAGPSATISVAWRRRQLRYSPVRAHHYRPCYRTLSNFRAICAATAGSMGRVGTMEDGHTMDRQESDLRAVRATLWLLLAQPSLRDHRSKRLVVCSNTPIAWA